MDGAATALDDTNTLGLCCHGDISKGGHQQVQQIFGVSMDQIGFLHTISIAFIGIPARGRGFNR